MAKEFRTFKQLQKEKSFNDFNAFAKSITEIYATSDIAYSQMIIAFDNHLTKKCLRDLMDYAISCALVSREICEQVLKKSILVQGKKSQGTGGKSVLHHKKLIKCRESFLLGMYARADVEKIANDVAQNTFYSIHHFTVKYNIESDMLTKKILERAIVENIITDEVVDKIIERSLKGFQNDQERYKAKQYFAYLKQKRENEI